MNGTDPGMGNFTNPGMGNITDPGMGSTTNTTMDGGSLVSTQCYFMVVLALTTSYRRCHST